MTSHNASLPTTVSSNHTAAKAGEGLKTQQIWRDATPSTGKSNVVFAEFSILPKPASVAGAVDIDDLVAELASQSTENAEALVQGRQWVADTFYGDKISVAQLRLKKGWSQAELARRAQTSQPYIARLELGQVDPQLSTMRKIAAALETPMDVLVQALSAD